MGVTRRARCASRVAKALRAIRLVPLGLAAMWSSAWAQGVRPVADAIGVTPGRCLDSALLVARVAELRGKPDVDAAISLSVDETEIGVQLVVRREGTVAGMRTLELPSRDCGELREATALVAASALDGTLTEGIAPPVSRPRPPALVAPTGQPVMQPVPVVFDVGTPPRAASRVGIAVEIGALFAVVPGVAFGVAPSFDASITDGFDLRASALVSTSTSVDLETAGGTKAGEATVGLAAGRIDACLATRPSALRLRGCGGVLVGVVRGEGVDLVSARSDTAPWAAAALRVEVRRDLVGGFGIGLGIDGLVPFARPTLAASDADDAAAAELSPVGASVLAGPLYRF